MLRSANFGELNPTHNPETPSVLLEVAYHDAAADAAHLKEPEFRRIAARAILQGIIKYFAGKDGKPVHLPQKGLMRLLVHVEDMAEIFARVLLAEAPRHSLYNSGGIPVSLGELADIVRGFLPDAQITFASEGGREDSGNYLVDNSRLAKEFGIEFPGLHTRVLEVINDVRRNEGLPLATAR